ncbi:MAG: glutamate formimidoyltransferase [Bryobacteraceae bacterium]|nr:glutamate formimidoyltransferase [Bryobacteraceae bacterium]
MRKRLIECVANFSEGRDQAVIQAIVDAVEADGQAWVLHTTSDADHHRSVVTFVGAPESVVAAAARAVAVAVERIDLRRHEGVHPRIGAADVIPLVPIEDITLDECADLAHGLGEDIWRTTGVPVYFYEAAALRRERVRLEVVRKGGLAPDIGGPELHPTAGAVIIGARKILIAWNVNLATRDLSVARSIARSIRASSGGFPHVKALGLPLLSRGQVQVSMNLTDFDATPMHVVFEAIRSRAHDAGVRIAGTEIIGLLPSAALERAAEAFFQFENFTAETVLETRLRSIGGR